MSEERTIWYNAPVQEGETITIRGINGAADRTYRVKSVDYKGSGKYDLVLIPLDESAQQAGDLISGIKSRGEAR